MAVRLYTLGISNPGHATKAMLALKGIDYKAIEMLPGPHPQLIRLRGFKGSTVPALKINGRHVQGTRQIARALEDITPEPPLFPADPELRVAVEDAERWADEDLQNVPRRVIRLSATQSQEFRRWVAAEIAGVPLPGFAAATGVVSARSLAKKVDASEERTRGEIARLPATIAKIEKLIDDGVIGAEPNAADVQIGASMRLLLAIDRLGPLIDDGPTAEHARRLFPYPFRAEPLPWVLPGSWLEPLR